GRRDRRRGGRRGRRGRGGRGRADRRRRRRRGRRGRCRGGGGRRRDRGLQCGQRRRGVQTPAGQCEPVERGFDIHGGQERGLQLRDGGARLVGREQRGHPAPRQSRHRGAVGVLVTAIEVRREHVGARREQVDR